LLGGSSERRIDYWAIRQSEKWRLSETWLDVEMEEQLAILPGRDHGVLGIGWQRFGL
jgi:hypothetical protein